MQSEGATLLDITGVCAHHADSALEFLYKAEGEDPIGDAIWDPHPNPYVRRIVDLFTQRGLDRITGVRSELEKWLGGKMHMPAHERPLRPPGAMSRWSEAEVNLTRVYLQALPPVEFTFDDWSLLIDYLVQRYLPADDMRSEADWLSTRSSLMGRIEAARANPMISDSDADSLLASIPANPIAMIDRFGMNPMQASMMAFGQAHCAENIQAMSDGMRHRLKRFILEYQRAVISGDRSVTAESLQTRLFDEFGQLNRDWRRIAITEASENENQGLIASLPPTSRVRRVEKYRGACAFCRSIDGVIMEVVSADAVEKDGTIQIWPGKTNIGRSVAPRKKEGGGLVDREPHEMFWIAAGVQHPNCRGSWVHLPAATRPVDPAFSDWMDEVLKR